MNPFGGWGVERKTVELPEAWRWWSWKWFVRCERVNQLIDKVEAEIQKSLLDRGIAGLFRPVCIQDAYFHQICKNLFIPETDTENKIIILAYLVLQEFDLN